MAEEMKKIINPWLGQEGYLCYGCSPDNPQGLHMEFYEEGDDVVAFWKPDLHKQGWVNILHGGIQCTLMDEAAAWAVAFRLQTTGVTSKLEARFIKSISTSGECLEIRCRITGQKRNAVFIDAEIFDSKRVLCASAKIVYFVVSREQAKEVYHFNGCRTHEA